jgi:NAD(P)-dependent dehydrogenase (short-subunit alcohol dehydrogenase family)
LDAPRCVVVTGATSGIGRALALEFHRRGHRVYATGRNADALAVLEARGLRVCALEVTRADDIARLVERLVADGLGVDILINNAGYGQMGPLVELPLEQLRQQFEVNTFAPLATAQALLPLLLTSGQPKIVNVSSVSGVLTTPFAGAYCASKAAVTALSDALRMELAPFGIQVVTIQPGHIASSFGDTASAGITNAVGSRYAQIAAAVHSRATASQHRATTAEQFAADVADQILRPRSRPVLTLGRGARKLVLLGRFAPARLRDRILSHRFRLDELRRG